MPHAAAVKVAHPLLRAIAASKNKNDRIDASKIADCPRCDFLPESYIDSLEIRERRRTGPGPSPSICHDGLRQRSVCLRAADLAVALFLAAIQLKTRYSQSLAFCRRGAFWRFRGHIRRTITNVMANAVSCELGNKHARNIGVRGKKAMELIDGDGPEIPQIGMAI